MRQLLRKLGEQAPKRQRGGLGKEVRLAFDAGGRKARLGSDRAFSGGAGVITAGNWERIRRGLALNPFEF
jgi:hypothetical protein